jgi:hypothetical protein
MARKARPNTAEVTLRFRVPAGVTATQAKHLIWNNLTGTAEIYPDYHEEEVFGDQTIKPRAVAAKIIRARKKAKKR